MDSAIIGLIGGLIGSLITLVIGLLTTRFSYNNLFADTVSKSRNNWINTWRDELSKFLAIADMLRYEETIKKECNEHEYIELLKEYHIAKNKIIMRLNLNEKRHQEVYLLINKIAYEEPLENDDYKIAKEALMAVSRDLLKEEWERVKLEAKRKRKLIIIMK